ncbi:MAG TPA: xanthine dehydrogenase family protein subunit M [Chitinophagaceae bacterium]|nr:xanthine dehydrogenase family protein subunit M [Chitinophagaceae bacterium]
MINFEYSRVSSVKAAIDTLAKNPGAGFIAGGTNLVDLMKKGVTTPTRLIDINNLPLKQVEETVKGLSIGALAINSEVAGNALVQEKYPLLAMALHAGASAQLRNMATVGGNMMQRTRCGYFYDTTMPCNKRQPGSGCGALGGYNRMHAIFGASTQCIAVHPSDMCVALAALDATVQVAGPKAERNILFTDFHRLPGTAPQKDNTLQNGELITGITIPANPYTKNVYYLKVRDRASYAFALVSVAAALELDGDTIRSARLAMGGVAHKPWRLSAAEKSLAGKKATTENFKEAAKHSMEGAKSFGQNDFKLKMAPAAIVEALTKAANA